MSPPVAPADDEPPVVERPGHDKRPDPHAPAQPPVQLRDAAMPSALGRLVAIVVTVGLGWALAVAIGLWLLVFLVTRVA